MESVVRNAIYTVLRARGEVRESAASRMFVDTVRAQIPKWHEPAKLLHNLRPKKKTEPQ
jgi:hypothetical protein